MNIRCFSLLLVLTILLLVSSSASAVLDYKDKEIVGADTVINDDLLIYGDNVDIRGTVLGDVMAFGGKVTISGIVGDDVRIGAVEVVMEGNVGDDVFVGATTVEVSEEAYIGGDIVFGSGRMDVWGEVAGNIEGRAGDEVGNINVLSTARINGTIEYTSPRKVTIPPSTVIQEVSFNRQEPTGIFNIPVTISIFIGWLVAGNIPENPILNLAMGFALVVIGFVGSVVFMVTVIGIPIGLILLFVTLFALYAAFPLD